MADHVFDERRERVFRSPFEDASRFTRIAAEVVDLVRTEEPFVNFDERFS